MKEIQRELEGVKNQAEIHDALCGYLANNIAEILKFRGIIDEEQLEQIKRKNRELFTLKK